MFWTGNEWEVLTDKYGNTFYRHAITRQCEYDRPHDAVQVKPAEMLCSAYQVRPQQRARRSVAQWSWFHVGVAVGWRKQFIVSVPHQNTWRGVPSLTLTLF